MSYVFQQCSICFLFMISKKNFRLYFKASLCYVLSQRGVGNWTDFFFHKENVLDKGGQMHSKFIMYLYHVEWSAASWVILKPPTKSYVVICLVKFLSWYEVKRSLAATCAGKNVLYFDAWLSDLTFENLWQSAVNHALCLLFINSEINLTNRQTLNKNSETWKFFFGSSAQTFKLTKVLEKNSSSFVSGRCFALCLIQIFFFRVLLCHCTDVVE